MSGHRWLCQGGGAVRREHPNVLLCYPHAGAGAGAYADWPQVLGGRFDVLGVQPPGRHDRLADVGPGSVCGLAAELVAEITSLGARQIALFGHSFGALVMLEVAHQMTGAGLPAPAALILSGNRPPPSSPPETAPPAWTDEELLELCRGHGADEVAELCLDSELRKLVLPPLRMDMQAAGAYRIPDGLVLPDVPMLVLRGADDPATPPDTAGAWSRLTTGPVDARTYAGGHFFIRSARRQVISDLDGYLARIGPPVAARRTGDPVPVDPVTVAAVFAEVLGRVDHPVDVSLAAAGGNSLHAIRIATALSTRLEVTVPVTAVLSQRTPVNLAAHLSSVAPDLAPAVPAAVDRTPPQQADTWPLPTPQRRIWLSHERQPKRLDHLVTVSLKLGGRALPPRCIAAAWAELVRRHPTLRMRVVDGPDPVAVADAPDAGLTYLDATALPEFLADDLIDEELDRIRRTPVDLRTGPVSRAVLIRHPDETTTLELVIHHIACDGWSLRILIDELFTLAVAEANGQPVTSPPPAVGYADFASWERGASARWPSMLDQAARDLLPVPERLRLPHVDGPDRDAVEVGIGKDSDWAARLQRAFATSSHPPLVIGLVAVAVTLQQLSGQEVMYLAVPVTNRPPDFAEVIGDFVNTAIVRVDLGGTGDLDEVLRRTAAQAARVYEHQDLPFEEVVSLLRTTGENEDVAPRVAVTVQNMDRHRAGHDVGAVTVTWTEIAERESKFDLVVTIDPDDREHTIMITGAPSVVRAEAADALVRRIDRAMALVLDQIGA